MGERISFSPPDITEAEINEVVDTLRSGWITTGPKTKLFENKLAELCETGRAACLSSATAAMELTLRLLGVGEGDEVITTAYTYTATASVVCHVGARLVLVDTQKNAFEMDYDALERAITPRTKVVIPVDLGGVMCDYDRIFDIVERKQFLFQPKNELQRAIGRVIVMTDAAHALGAVRKGRHCGSVADFTCFSFHAVKNLTTAEGGAATWNAVDGFEDDWIYRQYMLMSLHGQNKDALAKTQLGSWEYDIAAPLYKCNMTDLQAAIGLGQLSRYESLLNRRRELVRLYNRALMGEDVITLPHFTADGISSCHLYLVKINGKDDAYRRKLIVELAEQGIAANVHYKPLPLLTAYRSLGFDIADFPNAFEMYQSEVTLPLHTLLTDEQAAYVVETFCRLLHD